MGSANKEYVVLVDKNDHEIGTLEKMQAHQEGKLHRAFSVFVFNSDGKLFLQKRANGKYHSAGLWTNTCCSHPRPGENIMQAAHRRLQEEMGFDSDLREVFSFTYRAELNHNLIEYEFDHVLFGIFDGVAQPNPEEASDWCLIGLPQLLQKTRQAPENYTYWLRISMERVVKEWENFTIRSSTL